MDNELKGMLNLILEKVGGLDSKVTGLDSKVTSLDSKVTGLDSKVTGLDSKVTGLDSKVTGLDSKVTRLENEVAGLKNEVADVKQLATKTALIQENEIIPKLQLIYENQVDIIEQNKQFKAINNNLENLNTDVFVLKVAVKELQLKQA